MRVRPYAVIMAVAIGLVGTLAHGESTFAEAILWPHRRGLGEKGAILAAAFPASPGA
jgi:hypothetical protein